MSLETKKDAPIGGVYTNPSTGEEVSPPPSENWRGNTGPKSKSKSKSKNGSSGHYCYKVYVDWIRTAGTTRAGVMTGLGLIYTAGRIKRKRFKVEPVKMRELGVDRKVQAKGLRELEAAGLIAVEPQGRGRSPIVTILRPDSYPPPPGKPHPKADAETLPTSKP